MRSNGRVRWAAPAETSHLTPALSPQWAVREQIERRREGSEGRCHARRCRSSILGGVLIDWNPRHLYRKLFADIEAAMEDFLATVCNSAWNIQQDGGIGRSVEATRELILAYSRTAPS